MRRFSTTIFHALAGRPPFDGSDATAVVKARFLSPAPPLRDVRPDIDPEIESIVARMLQVEPSMRYPTYESLLSDMRRFLEHAGPAATLSSKKVTLKKRNGATGPVPATVKTSPVGVAPTSSMPAVSVPGKGSGKLVIKKGGVSPSFDPAAASTSATASLPQPTGSHEAVAEPETNPPEGGRNLQERIRNLQRLSKPVLAAIALAGLLLLGGAAAGIWFAVGRGGKKPEAKPPEAAVAATNQPSAAMLAAQADAIRQFRACQVQALSAGSNLLAWAGTAEQLCAVANKAVADVLGADAHDTMIPLRPPPPAKPQPAAGTNAAEGAAAPEPPAAPPVDPVREDSLKEPVLVQVRNMYRAWYRMDDLAAEAMAISDGIASTIVSARTAPPEALKLQVMDFSDRVQPFLSGAKADEARRKLANIRNDLITVSNQVLVIRKRLDKEASLARQQADLEKQRQALAKQESDRQEKIKGEVAGIAAKELEINDLLHKYMYAEARRQLRTVYSRLTEEESLKAYAVATQRVARLEGLQEFMITHVPGYQHPVEGWKIESADRNNLVVRNTKNVAADVAWADLGDVRMVLFMRHFLMDEEVSRNLKLREHVRALIDASLYCRKFVPENKHVQELADKMLERAVTLLPDSREEIEQLLPNAGLKSADPDKPAADAAAK